MHRRGSTLIRIPRQVIGFWLAAGALLSPVSMGVQNNEQGVDRKQLIVRGVAYPRIASMADSAPALPAKSCFYARDLSLIAATGANTVQTYDLIPEKDHLFTAVLESTGLYWLAGFPLEPFYDPTQPISAKKTAILEAFRRYADRYRTHPRLLGFVFGNNVMRDYNLKFAGSAEDFNTLVVEAETWLRSVQPENTPPVLTTVDSMDIPAGFDDLFEAEQQQVGHSDLTSLLPRELFFTLRYRWQYQGSGSWVKDPPPKLNSFTNAASGWPVAAPGALIRVSGSGFGETQSAGIVPWPLTLGTTCLCIGDVPVPVGFSSPEVLTAQTPWDLPPGDYQAVVFSMGVASNILSMHIEETAPGIFPDAVVRAGTQCLVTQDNGVRPGELLEVYGTGMGEGRNLTSNVEAFVNHTSAEVLYAGLVAGLVGLNQVNVKVPYTTPPSPDAGLEIRVNGSSSNVYPMSVVRITDPFGIRLTSPQTEITLQPGGPVAKLQIRMDGRNGYCGPVLLAGESLPPGVRFRVPVSFTGGTANVEVWADAASAPVNNAKVSFYGYANGVTGDRVSFRLTLLASRGIIPIRIISGGYKSKPIARFEWNGYTLYSVTGGGPGRGINVMSVNPVTGVYSPVRNFDTWGDASASEQLINYLSDLPSGTIVLFAVADEASYRLSDAAREMLVHTFGSRAIRELGYQQSWAMVARKGFSAPLAEGISTDTQVVLDFVLKIPES